MRIIAVKGIVLGGLGGVYWGPPIYGNYHMVLLEVHPQSLTVRLK